VLITFTIQMKYYPAKMNCGLKLLLIVSKVDCSTEKKIYIHAYVFIIYTHAYLKQIELYMIFSFAFI